MLKFILLVLFIILGATFSVVNRQDIFLHYFFGFEAGPFPLFLLIFLFLGSGMVLGFSIGWGERRKLRAQARQFETQVAKLQDELIPFMAPKKPESPPTQDASNPPHP